MINFIDLEPDDVIGIHINGDITEKEFEAVATLLEKKIETYPKINLYVEMERFGGMGPKTILKDLRLGLGNLDHFKKEAIVTEKDWVEKVSSVSDEIFTGIDIKSFSFDEREEAKQWVQS